MSFTVAIIGRPNVGKSTLFNRLVGKRLALVDDTPGVTRDRREGTGRIGDLSFQVIDTAGLEDVFDDSLEARMRRQTELAIEDADVALLLRRDGRAVVGYHERASHHIIDVTECPVLDPALVALLEPLRALSAKVLRPGKRASAVATVTDAGVDLLLDPGRALDLAAREALAAFADETDLARLSARDTDAGFIDPVARRRPAIHRFAGVAVEPPPGGFLQASPAAEATGQPE